MHVSISYIFPVIRYSIHFGYLAANNRKNVVAKLRETVESNKVGEINSFEIDESAEFLTLSMCLCSYPVAKLLYKMLIKHISVVENWVVRKNQNRKTEV